MCSMESDHTNCASFGMNLQIMVLYLRQLSKAVTMAKKLSRAFNHKPLRLDKQVTVELVGFYMNSAEASADVRMYSVRCHIKDFLEKGPEQCLERRGCERHQYVHESVKLKP